MKSMSVYVCVSFYLLSLSPPLSLSLCIYIYIYKHYLSYLRITILTKFELVRDSIQSIFLHSLLNVTIGTILPCPISNQKQFKFVLMSFKER